MSDEIHIQEFRQPTEGKPRRRLPVWAYAAIGGALVALVAVILLFVMPGAAAGRSGQAETVSLSADNPSYFHSDGLSVLLANGAGEAQVSISSTPREAFVSGSAGRQWAAAHAAVPGSLSPLSPLYTLDVRGEAEVLAQMSIPDGAEPLERLDLYRWDAQTGEWVFVPSRIDRAGQVIEFSPEPGSLSVMAFQAASGAPAVAMVISPGGAEVGGSYAVALPEGPAIDESGSLSGEPAEASAPTVMPVVANRAGGFTAYADPPAPLFEELAALAGPYDGLTLDFDTGEAYATFVGALAERLQADGKQLGVILRTSDLPAADLAAIGRQADRVWISPAHDPAAYLPGNTVDQMMMRIVGQIERAKLGLLVSALHVDVTDQASQLVSFEDAAAPLGEVQVADGYLGEDGSALAAGSVLPLRLDGAVESLGYDEALQMNYLTYHDEAGALHHVYFASAANLQSRLRVARQYGLAAVAVHGLAQPGAPARLADGLTAFLSEQPLAEPQPLEIVWEVEDASGAALSRQQGDLSLLQYLWDAGADPGAYRISALLSDQSESSRRGEVEVEVVEGTPTPTPTPTAAAAAARPTPAATPTPTDEPEEEDVVAPPPPVAASGAGGGFELGGQVPGVIAHPNEMYAAGMSWVKYQIKWGPGADPSGAAGYIGQGHANGFKVLLSIPGPFAPSSIDYDAYVNYLRGVASYGPDAIEIWNEMNLYTEWPRGQYSPTDYVNRMLAPAFNAIKSVSPNTMVIIGALAPTGVDDMDIAMADYRYLQGLAAAGAARYADCVGAHHNAGATSPSATTGHPADGGGGHHSWYFRPTIDVYYSGMGGALPVCLTEFGYVSGEGYGELPSNWSWGSGITVQNQADWLAEGVRIARSLGYVRLMIIWNVDFTYWGSDPQAGYAIVRPDGSCPACGTLGAAMQ